MNVQVSKTVLSVGDSFSVFKFVDVGTKLVEFEAGMTEITLAPLTVYDTSNDLTSLAVSQGHIFLDVSAGQVQRWTCLQLCRARRWDTGVAPWVRLAPDMRIREWPHGPPPDSGRVRQRRRPRRAISAR